MWMMFKSIAYVRKTTRGRNNGVLGYEKERKSHGRYIPKEGEPSEEELWGQNTAHRNLCLCLHICIWDHVLLRMKKAVKSQSIKAFHACMLSYFSHVWLSLCDPMDCNPPTRFLCPWDSPGKNTGVGCHFLLQGIFPIQGSKPWIFKLGFVCNEGIWCSFH